MGLQCVYDTPAKISFSWIEGAMKTSSAETSWKISCDSISSIVDDSYGLLSSGWVKTPGQIKIA